MVLAVWSDPSFWLILVVAVIIALLFGAVLGAFLSYKIRKINQRNYSASNLINQL